MPSITQLQYLVAVHTSKHFGRAAEECHVSQPSLSAQIHKAEDELGIVVFDRSKQPVITTALGRKVITLAEEILRQHRQLFAIDKDEAELSGNFRLGVIPTLAPYVIPLFIEAFAARYPKVKLAIDEYKTEDIVKHLYSDAIDCGLLVTPLYDKKIHEKPLFLEPFYAFSAKNHAYNDLKSIKESQLDPESIWLLDEGHCFRDQVMRICHLSEKKQVLSNVSFSGGNLETLINIIRKGRGYTLLPYLASRNLTPTEQSQQLRPFAKPIPTREVSLVYSRSQLKSRIIKALASEILAALPKGLRAVGDKDSAIVDI